jgi:hypothetical protein
MKPTQSDIDWCLANRDFIARLLEKRGGWREGDWCLLRSSRWTAPVPDHTGLVHDRGGGSFSLYELSCYEEDYPDGEAYVWLATEGDALAMLEWPNNRYLDMQVYGDERHGFTVRDNVNSREGKGKTVLIALLELLKETENGAGA